jgi:hypothetical protein
MSFTASHISRSHTIHLEAPPDQVFPLFEPVGEQSWAPDWKPTFLFPPSGAAQAGAVFTTQVHEDDGQDTIWAISTYDPDNLRLAYLRVTPGSRVGIIDIRCAGTFDGRTEATITYTFTGLSDEGNEFIARLTPAHYQEYIASWETAINHYLHSGQSLAHH